jgi:site-specific DNA-methyltransferase (adenine-specific)
MIQLYKGDCLEVMKSIADKSIDAIITDPPYGTTACKWDSVIPFDLMWEQLNRIIKDNGAIALFGQNPFSALLIHSNINNYRYDFCWKKEQATNFANIKAMPGNIKEDILVFSLSSSKQIKYYPQMVMREKPIKITSSFPNEDRDKHLKWNMETISRISDSTYPTNVIEFTRDRKSTRGLHPTQKPVALMEYLIKTYTKENETVLDFTMGSGTTGVACVNTNRNFIGIEMDDKYFEIAEKRIKEAQINIIDLFNASD